MSAQARQPGELGSTLRPLAAPVAVSFEFFPPGDAAMEQTLWRSIQRLAPLRPRFVSVTYGADGSTRERTHQLVSRVLRETTLTPAPHLTCVGARREAVLEIAHDYWRQGVRHIVALRGDPPQGAAGYAPHAGGFAHRDRCVAAGVSASLVPGILPITRLPQMLHFAARCGATVPEWLRQRFDGLDDDAETRRMISAAFAIGQVEALAREGVQEFHFYTLNRADLTYAICHALGVRT